MRMPPRRTSVVGSLKFDIGLDDEVRGVSERLRTRLVFTLTDRAPPRAQAAR